MMVFHTHQLQFSDKSKHIAQLSLIKDAAYISIIYMLHLSANTNASHNNSNCDAVALRAVEMGVLYFETGGMKHDAPAAVKLEADFSVLLQT